MTTIAYESAIIEQPIDRVWACLRTMDFVFNPRVQSTRMGLDRVVPARPWGVGEVGVITYVDGTKQDVRLTELSDANHTVSYEVVSSTPAVTYSSAQTTITCRRVTDSAVKGGATFVEWEVDFSRDADGNVVADAAFKAKDALSALKVEAAKTWNWYSTAEAAAQGYNLAGKYYVVTGGNSGIGFETVRVLAAKGAHVVFTARDDKKIADTVADLKKGQAAAKVEGMVCALDDFKSIRAFAAAYKAKGYPITALILNAGVMACPFGKTAQGFETQVGTNHIGHHLLTTLLLDVLKKSAPARVVVVSSAAHRRGDVRLDDLNYTARPNEYEPWSAYGQSKTANILFAKALHARLAKEGVKVSVNSLHPGVIPTNLSRHIGPVFAPQKPGAAAAGAGADAKDNAKDKKDDFATKTAASLQSPLFVPRIKSIPQGAATTIVAALHPAYAEAGGLYLSDCNPIPTLPHANDLAKAEKLWELTEKLIADSKA